MPKVTKFEFEMVQIPLPPERVPAYNEAWRLVYQMLREIIAENKQKEADAQAGQEMPSP